MAELIIDTIEIPIPVNVGLTSRGRDPTDLSPLIKFVEANSILTGITPPTIIVDQRWSTSL